MPIAAPTESPSYRRHSWGREASLRRSGSLWRASVRLALRDMKAARRSLEFVAEEALREFV